MESASAQVAVSTAAIGDALDRLVSVDLGALPADELTRLVRTIARTEARLAGLTARAVAAARSVGAVEASGSPTPVIWLADATGSTTHSASRAVSLGRAIDAAPAIGDGLAQGTLATDKATTLARALDRGVLGTSDVDRLVEDARRLPAGVFAREVRAREAAADNARLRRDEQWARQRRSLTTRRDDDGSVEGRFRLDPLAGDTVLTALRSLATLDLADTPIEQRRTRAQRDADALEAMARHALDDGVGGSERSTRPHISVLVPVQALAPDGGTAAGLGAVGTSEHGTPLSMETVRQLLCDAAIRRVVVAPEGRPLDVGRATRSWSGAQRVASAAVDGGCRGPSCDRPFAWTYLHHIDWWSEGGHTDIDRGIPLCGHCHRLVHDHEWHVDLDAATRIATWTSPAGRTTTTYPRGPAAPTRLGSTGPRTGGRAGPAGDVTSATSGPTTLSTSAEEPVGRGGVRARHDELVEARSPGTGGHFGVPDRRGPPAAADLLDQRDPTTAMLDAVGRRPTIEEQRLFAPP